MRHHRPRQSLRSQGLLRPLQQSQNQADPRVRGLHHFGDMGHFIIGDDKYGEPSNPIKRLGLHAYELDIIHPFSGKLLKFKAAMPKEFETLMAGNAPKCKNNKRKS